LDLIGIHKFHFAIKSKEISSLGLMLGEIHDVLVVIRGMIYGGLVVDFDLSLLITNMVFMVIMNHVDYWVTSN